MQGSPQQPDLDKLGLHIPIRIRLDPPADVDIPAMRPQREEEMPKRVSIKKHRFEESGYTEDCEGCKRQSSGDVPRTPRQESCRKRI